jgi:hypothetical protein
MMSAMRRLNPRGAASVVGAILLVLIGVWRYASDLLGDAHRDDPAYWARIASSPVRYFVRAPSDGTLWGDLNTQWFKVLSIPCAMALVYLWHRRRFGSLREGAFHFRQPWVRGLWIGTFWVAFTLIEVEKRFQLFGTRTAGIHPGETFTLNQVAHLISAALAWVVAASFSFEPVLRPDPPASPAPAG